MAKWGEGDPRWIVEDRADATNVNNWHWTEKNATGWSQTKLKALLEGLRIEDDNYSCQIVEVSKMEGEASANNRKAKLIFFYEWEIKAEWKGNIKGLDKSHKGDVLIPNLSDENTAEDIDVIVTTKSENDDSFRLKQFMNKTGAEKIREQLAKYINDLKTDFTEGMVLQAKPKPPAAKTSAVNVKTEMSQPVVSSNGSNYGVKIRCKSLTQSETFKCRADDLYRALTDQSMVCAFTRDNAQYEAEKGGRFALFGGNITGTFSNLEFNKQIVMKWRSSSWPEEHYSLVTLDLVEKENSTELKLNQTGIPENEFERTEQGWKRHYWEPIKQTFGFGARLL